MDVRFVVGHAPSARVGHTMNAIGHRLFLLGGRDYASNFFDPSLHVFDTISHRWSRVNLRDTPGKELPMVRTGHCTDAHEGSLVVFGGLCEDGNYRDDVSWVKVVI